MCHDIPSRLLRVASYFFYSYLLPPSRIERGGNALGGAGYVDSSFCYLTDSWGVGGDEEEGGGIIVIVVTPKPSCFHLTPMGVTGRCPIPLRGVVRHLTCLKLTRSKLTSSTASPHTA